MTAATSETAHAEKRWVAFTSVLAAVFLTGAKVIVGVLTGSLGILSEAIHSALDLVAALVTFWAVRAASLPADDDHTYGHGKVENLSALFETALLLATCVWIAYEAVRRLFFAEVHVQASGWAFAVVIVSIVVDVSRSRALMAAAKKYQSQALEADALHFSTDVWSSAVVLLGLGCVALADPLGLPWLVRMDALAALGVAAIVVWVSVRLGKKSVNDLLDAVPAELPGQITAAAAIPGIASVGRVRVRRSGPETFVELVLTASPEVSFERAHELTVEVERAVCAAIGPADVVVHIEPLALAHEAADAMIHRLALRHGLNAHHVEVADDVATLHVEVEPDLPLSQAHALVTGFEQEVRHLVPGLTRIVTHLEPRAPAASTAPPPPVAASRLESTVEVVCARFLTTEPHALRIRAVGEQLDISFHCVMPADTPVASAHEVTDRIEAALRTAEPTLRKVTIHVEPPRE